MTVGLATILGNSRGGVNAATFDGSNDYLRKSSLTGAVDSSSFSLVVWLRPHVLAANDGIVYCIDPGLLYQLFALYFGGSSPSNITLTATSSAGASRISYSSTTTLANNTLYCLMISSNGTTLQAYLGDTAMSGTGGITNSGTIGFSAMGGTNGINIGALDGTGLYDGDMAEFYLAIGQRIDFSVQANRRKFYSATGKPVSLGSTGSLPTGTAPTIYLKNPASTFNVNSGTGGDFTMIGTLTPGVSPSL